MVSEIRRICLGAAILACACMCAPAGAWAQHTNQLNICHAGSVSKAFAQVENSFESENPGVVVKDFSGGSLDLARQLANGLQNCDLYASADYTNIDLLLKPAGFATYTIVFAEGRMVLGYLDSDPNARGIARPGSFNPPDTVPEAVPDWYRILLAPNVKVGGAHPFLDPGAYRSHLIFQLTQGYYKVPNLYNDLLKHYTTFSLADASKQTAISSDFQFTYEHSAQSTAKKNPDYRYVRLPDNVDLSDFTKNNDYSRAVIVVPGLGLSGTALSVTIPGCKVAWGVTILSKSPNQDNAMKFLQLLLGGVGTAALTANGPKPVSPAVVSVTDFKKLPPALRSLVKASNDSP
jgi:tungstate ABC transporter binding protein WtpA